MTGPTSPGANKNVIYASNVALLIGGVLILVGVFAGPDWLIFPGVIVEVVAVVLAQVNRSQRKSRGH